MVNQNPTWILAPVLKHQTLQIWNWKLLFDIGIDPEL
jgi:hypothetical protein